MAPSSEAQANGKKEAIRRKPAGAASKKRSRVRKKAVKKTTTTTKKRVSTRKRGSKETVETAEPALVTDKRPPEEEARGGKRGWKNISRKELFEKALERVKRKLESDDDLNQATIGALVQLLKVDREIVEADEVPQEIRVLWQEINGESSSGE